MSVALSKKGPVLATDANAALINLYLAVQQGWDPPSVIAREDHEAAKALPDTDPRKAFVGFGCCFGGTWFGGYASDAKGRNYASESRRAVVDDVAKPRLFGRVDFLDETPRPISAIVYADPPYAGTSGYKGVGAFDSARFIDRVCAWAVFSHVFVSEYHMPVGHCVWERTIASTVSRDKASKPRTERLYYLPKGSRW